MSVELYIGKEFDTTYEREALSRFVRSMGNSFGSKNELCIILANYTICGRTVDLTVLKRDAVIVIELKTCDEEFSAYSNKDWKTKTGKIVGYTGHNPYQQVMGYRSIWIEFLKENKRYFNALKNIKNGNNRPFNYTKGYVAIFPYIKECYCEENLKENWRFDLCGLNELDEKISMETNKIINFSEGELRFIAAELLSMENPRIIQTTDAENLAEQIKKSADGLNGIIEECKKKIAQFEKYIHENNEIIAGLRSCNDQLTNSLRQNSDIIKQMKLDKNKRDEEIQAADTEKFRLISECIVINYYSGRKNKEEEAKFNNLIKLSGIFGITRKNAIEIVKKAINQSRKCK